ncbi:hypothetical protein [Halobellus sp. GM3]|uniref:hypothetical protein n=1 Tax=Halobellus sp. GM3 TaxID=3458410 RepID=UPI00403D9C1C
MSFDRRTYPSWGLVGSGTAGRRVASQIVARGETDAVDDRVVFLDTGHAVRGGTLDRTASALAIGRGEVNDRHVITLDPTGVGGDFLEAERAIEARAPEVSARISRTLEGARAVVHLCGVGGGTGAGTVPFLAEQLSDAFEPDGLAQFSLAVWPFEHEPTRRHFNAVCALSRLVAGDEGSPTADMTILASNSRLAALARSTGASPTGTTPANDVGAGGDLTAINERLATALELVFESGRQGDHVITPSEYAAIPRRRGIAHATFGTALGEPVESDLESAIERATENAFVPLDPSTAEAVSVVVRAPEPRLAAGDVTRGELEEAVAAWENARGIRGAVGTTKLVSASAASEALDVLVFLGGFDLDPLLDPSVERYEREREFLDDANHHKYLEHADRAASDLERYRSD